MEAAVERRDVDENRVPLDSPVELSHEGFTESFEADGVNVSAGGVSMRASYLPSVGARLRCRIPAETAGGHIEAGAEVVWSADQGPHNGEFGLRFLDIDDASARAIRSMLSRGPYLPPSPKGKPGAEDTIDEARPAASVSLGIDGVPDSIRASVVAEDSDILTVSQELPFLRLATGVTVHQDGRRGRIEGIDLTLDGDTPKLLIDILFDEAPVNDPSATASDSTIPDFLPMGHEPREFLHEPQEPQENLDQAFAVGPGETVHTAPTAVDLTSPPARDEVARAAEVAPAVREPRIVQVSPVVADANFRDDSEEIEEIEEDREDQAVQASEASAEFGAEADGDSVPNLEVTPAPLAETAAEVAAIEVPRGNVAAVTAARAMTALRSRVDALRPRVTGAFGKLGAHSGGLRAKIGPRTVALRAKVMAFFAMLRTEALPRVVASVRRTGRVFARTAIVVRDKVGQKIPLLARRAKRRRKTAPPPTDSNVAGRRSSRRRTTAPAPKKDRRRTMVVSFVAFSGVALAVWALTPGSETVGAADPLGGHQSIVNQPPAPSPAAAPAVAPAAATAAVPVAGAAALPPVVGEPAMPRAVGEGSREAGPMAAPTFPSLRDGAHPQAAQGLPEGSPYAVDVREGGAPAATATSEGSVFGAPDIENGRSFLIRMSQPVTVIRGTARADGFTVEIPSSLSLDRAGPIAASHPLIERSMILNRGDHSELTISFVSGRTPAYRVSARGSAIEVLIARR